jgi:hypothetical protein
MLKLTEIAFLLAAALTLVSWLMKGRLPEPREIAPELLTEPVQEPTTSEPFSFDYRGRGCRVRPVARYELAGVVVSHNDIESFADLYHDSSSVDTKDLCVVWGPNLERSDFRRVDYRSGSFTCYFRHPPGVRFSRRGLGNNHLITDSAAVRERIAAVRVGDQVLIRGLLVDYQMEDWRDVWRRTSTVRADDGCEVIFVESIEVLRRGTPGWYRAFRAAGAVTLGLPALYLVLLHRSVRRRAP